MSDSTMTMRTAKCEDTSLTVLRRQFETASLVCAIYPAGSVITEHVHQKPVLTLMIAGRCSHSVGRDSSACLPKQLHYIPEGVPHGCVAHTPASWLLLEVEGAILQRLPRPSRELPAGALPQNSFGAFATRMVAEIQRDDDASALAVDCLIGEILLSMCRQKESSTRHFSPSVLRARELMCDQFRSTIRIADVARAVRMHPSHLAREFRRAFRCTMGDYLRELRVKKATELLNRTHASLLEISQQCGFCDQSHFSKCFKRITGLSPAVYRDRAVLTDNKNLRTLQALQDPYKSEVDCSATFFPVASEEP